MRPIDGRDSHFFGFSHCIWPILPPTCQMGSANTDQKNHTDSAILHQKSCGKPNATTSYHLGMVNMPPIFDDFLKFGQFLALDAGGTRMVFGKEVKVKPQPAKTVVKAFPVKGVKDSI